MQIFKLLKNTEFIKIKKCLIDKN